MAADRFGGISDLSFTGTPLRGIEGFFRTGLQGTRAGLIDPDGNWYPWKCVWNVGTSGSISPKPTDLGKSCAAFAIEKYGDNNLKWSQATIARLKRMGFTGTQIYSSAWVSPAQAYGGYGHYWQTLDPRPEGGTVDWQTDQTKKRGQSPFPQPSPMPVVSGIRVTHYGSYNNGNKAPDAFKGIYQVKVERCDLRRFGSVAFFPDVFDPNWLLYMKAVLRLGPYKWRIAVFVDDTDEMIGFGNGPDFKAARPGQPNIGWAAFCGRYWVVTGKANNGATMTYQDPRNFTKLRAQEFLKTKYVTIEALNAAWGSDYTTWDEEDPIGHTSWGTGTGFLDEDGRSPWMGAGFSAEISGGNLAHCSPGVKADADAFVGEVAEFYFRNVSEIVKAQTPHLYGGIFNLGSWGVPPHREVLRAAGQYLDLVHATPIDAGKTPEQNQAQLDFFVEHLGTDHPVPMAMWVGAIANPDSAMNYGSNANAGFPTQARRGQYYRDIVELLMTAKTKAGIHIGIGPSWWGYYDQWNEFADWGLVSIRQGIYNAKSAVKVPPPVDEEGYPNIPEDEDYGDFISHVVATNARLEELMRAQILDTPVPAPEPPPAVDSGAFVSMSVPTAVLAGETFEATIRMKNTGTTTWRAADGYVLRNLDPGTWGVAELALPTAADGTPGAVVPGDEVAFRSADFIGFSTAGIAAFPFRWQLHQGATAFGPVVAATIEIEAPAPPPGPEPSELEARVAALEAQMLAAIEVDKDLVNRIRQLEGLVGALVTGQGDLVTRVAAIEATRAQVKAAL